MKRCSSLLAIREMQINITGYHCATIRMTTIKRTDRNGRYENVEEPELSHTAKGFVEMMGLSLTKSCQTPFKESRLHFFPAQFALHRAPVKPAFQCPTRSPSAVVRFPLQVNWGGSTLETLLLVFLGFLFVCLFEAPECELVPCVQNPPALFRSASRLISGVLKGGDTAPDKKKESKTEGTTTLSNLL